MNDFARKPRIPWLCIGEEYMRNPLGLLLGCVVAAVMIAGAWLFATSLRADQAAPQTVAAKPAPLPPVPTKLAAKDLTKDLSRDLTKDDLDITGSLSGRSAAALAPLPLPVPQ